MQVPNEVQKCVVFLGCNTKKGFSLAGTAFFVASNLKNNKFLSSLVTARHVIDKIMSVTTDGHIFIRVNMTDGSSKLFKTKQDEWICHEEVSVDAAILPFSPSQALVDFLPINIQDMALTKKIIEEEGIGPGDETFLTGLFINHFGGKRNAPIIRSGNIAILPEEKVRIGNGYGDVEAYLIETRSIGGLSGSPVFVYLGAARIKNKTINLGSRRLFYWLGLMHGHWNVHRSKSDAQIIGNTDEDELHSGIAVVIPTHKIIEILNYDIFKKRLESVEKED